MEKYINGTGGSHPGRLYSEPSKTDFVMKGYLTNLGYFGWVGERYLLFPTEAEYREYMKERNNER